MAERTFIIQRYASGNWPMVQGRVPFLATGPAFSTYAYGLDEHREWKFTVDVAGDFERSFAETDDPRFYAAWALLELGWVQALWSDRTDVPTADWWTTSVEQLASEIPKGPIGEAVVDFLSGLAAPGHFRSYVAEDQIELVAMPCPTL